MALTDKQEVKKNAQGEYELHDSVQKFTKNELKDKRTRLKNLQKLDEQEVLLCHEMAINQRIPFADQIQNRLDVIEDLLKGADDADSLR